MHIVGNVPRVPTQVVERTFEGRRDLSAGTKLIDFNRQETQRLADVIVQLAPDAAALAIHARFPRTLALRLDLSGTQERMPPSCRLARMMGDWYLRRMEKQPNAVQTI